MRLICSCVIKMNLGEVAPRHSCMKRPACSKRVPMALESVIEDDFGVYKLERRLNTDQVPLQLDNNWLRSYIPSGSAQAQITGIKCGDKRFGTLQVTILHHQGVGTVQAAEAAHYDPRVDVFCSSHMHGLTRTCPWLVLRGPSPSIDKNGHAVVGRPQQGPHSLSRVRLCIVH